MSDILFGLDRDPNYGDTDDSCCVVDCSSCRCRASASFTDQIYRSDFIARCFDLGQYCPVTECCNAPVCFKCAPLPRIFCSFCLKLTNVEFLDKNHSGYFSEKTACESVGSWFCKIWQFHELQEQLNGDRQLFFLWLRTQKGCMWRHFHHEFNSWYDLASEPLRKQAVICGLSS